MDKGQILMDYRLAKNHKRQIPILADLNVCDTQKFWKRAATSVCSIRMVWIFP